MRPSGPGALIIRGDDGAPAPAAAVTALGDPSCCSFYTLNFSSPRSRSSTGKGTVEVRVEKEEEGESGKEGEEAGAAGRGGEGR